MLLESSKLLTRLDFNYFLNVIQKLQQKNHKTRADLLCFQETSFFCFLLDWPVVKGFSRSTGLAKAFRQGRGNNPDRETCNNRDCFTMAADYPVLIDWQVSWVSVMGLTIIDLED